MVATAIRTYDELVALQKDPAQFVDWLGQVAAEKFADVAEETIKSAVTRSIAVAKLPGRPSMTDDGTRPTWLQGERFEKATKAGYHFNPDIVKEYGSHNGGFETLRDYMSTVYGTKNGNWSPKLKAALSEAAAALGGALVPEEYRMELRMLQLESSQIRGRATVLPMGSLTQKWPYVRDTSHVSSVFGGVIGFWEGEAQALQESEPTFAMMDLTAKKLTAYTVMSNEVMTDSAGAAEAFVTGQFPKALNFFEDRGFWRGVGGGMPKGILSANPARIDVTRDVAGTITWNDITQMSAHFLPSSENSIVWFANPSVKPALYTMAINVGTGGAPVFINPLNGGGASTPPNQILGRPLVFTEHLSALGTVGDLVAVDLSYYLIGDRQAMSMEASPHVKFVNDQTVWRVIQRLDGVPWLDSSLTLSDGSTTVSPFVAIAT